MFAADCGSRPFATNNSIGYTKDRRENQTSSKIFSNTYVHYRNSLGGDISPHWRFGTGYWFDKVVLVVVFIIKFNFWTIKNLLSTARSLKW